MKLKEFWIFKDFKFGVTSTFATTYEPTNQESTHVREVSPELDAAYKECERVLNKCQQELEFYSHSVGTIITERHWQSASGLSTWAKETLAILKKARGE